jgi:hypothetical protein
MPSSDISETVCYKEGTVNSITKTYAVLHNIIRIQEELFCQETENYAVNKSSYHILNDDDDGRKRLSRPQRLRIQTADYSLTPTGAIFNSTDNCRA